ncbi:MAG: hypothetical protein ACR2NQ_04765 [Thermodesulfobacteriota bacterium]
MDQKLKKWIQWLETIHGEIRELRMAQEIFSSVQELVKKNKNIQKPSSFYAYLQNTYVSYVLMGIRRQVKNDQSSISFVRLLTEMSKEPSVLHRTYFRQLYEGHTADSENEDFDRFCDQPGAPHISSSLVEEDMRKLEKTSRSCEKFADKRIAHLDQQKPTSLVTMEDVDDVISILDRLYVKYHLLFHAVSIETVKPTYQYDWMEIFDHPWRKNTE